MSLWDKVHTLARSNMYVPQYVRDERVKQFEATLAAQTAPVVKPFRVTLVKGTEERPK